MSAMLHTNDCVRQRAKFGARSSAGDVCSCDGEAQSLKVFKEQPYQHRIVKVRRVKDAIGAYCLDCQRVIADESQWQWSWRKSQLMHERGSGHQTIMYKVI